MTPWFIATEPFGPTDGERWRKYIEWSELKQLTELVSLDSMLCPEVLDETRDDYWPHIVNEDYMNHYFTDLDFLKQEVAAFRNINLLCVLRNPSTHFRQSPVDGFDFVGYDLVEAQTGISALTNCGGFPDVFANSELSCCGLLTEFARAAEVKWKLRFLHPEEPHANCDLWTVFRYGTN
jgi:hypothetical protein